MRRVRLMKADCLRLHELWRDATAQLDHTVFDHKREDVCLTIIAVPPSRRETDK